QVLAGQGAERHLQGLRQAAIAAGEPLPEIFMDPAYALATHFRLCTVQVPPGTPRTPPQGPQGPP
ncbi:Carnitine O-acetyltransferase, partial [Eudyptes moseleyi]